MLIWRGRTHGHFSVVAVLLLSLTALLGGAAHAEEPQARLAMGLIVKLKDAKPQSVVRLKASSVPSDNAPKQRQRMFDAAHRHRVSYLVQRPTAFAAHVIHPGHAIPWAQANAEAERLRADPDVEWVIVNEIVKRQAYAAPTDPGYQMGNNSSATSGLGQVWLQPRGSGPNLGVANVPGAWDFLSNQTTLSPVVVAVLDTGILPHPDLLTPVNRLLPGYDFVDRVATSSDGNGLDSDPSDTGDWVDAGDKAGNPAVFGSCDEESSSWHGLSIAGMLVANTNNGQGGAGMLHQLVGPAGPEMLMPVRVSGKCGADVSSIIEGMLWSAGVSYQGAPALPAHPAKVINLSFGGPGTCSSTPGTTGSVYLQTIATLANNGVLVVASAGNGHSDKGDATPSMPANCAGVLAVTGLNQRGYKATYANMISDGVAVASGDIAEVSHIYTDDGIFTTFNSGATVPDPSGYGMHQRVGTSFAAPQAAGVAAMMLAVNPGLSVQQLIDGIKGTSRAFPAAFGSACTPGVSQGNCDCTNGPGTRTCGSGVLDAGQAVAWAASASTSPAASPIISAPYFVPSRLSTAQSSGGGGGGATGLIDLLCLAGMAALAVFRGRAVALSRSAAGRVNSGRP